MMLRDRQWRRRRVFLLEKLLAEKSGLTMEEISQKPTELIATLRVSTSTSPTTPPKLPTGRYCKEFVNYSEALCGAQKQFVRNLRIFVSMLIFGMLPLTFSESLFTFTTIPQWLMVFTFTFRGAGYAMMAAFFYQTDPTDQTVGLFASYVVIMIFLSSGPSLLTMEHFVPLSLLLLTATITASVVAGSALALSSIWLSIPICAAFNYMMEMNERRFYALWEALCGGGVGGGCKEESGSLRRVSGGELAARVAAG
ncbi:hypothetical protein HDU67_006439 [Dinochytrium kinnereticum]|nr:hypothetical protein HDU67_006439 [Dinochytrium kinnereticum]